MPRSAKLTAEYCALAAGVAVLTWAGMWLVLMYGGDTLVSY